MASSGNPDHRSSSELIAAREYALEIIKLATGRPSPGGLLAGYDYYASLRKLHGDVLGLLGAEDARLIELAVALIRAAHDAERKAHLDPNLRNYYARRDDAARAAQWATGYVIRINHRSRQALVVHQDRNLSGTRSAPLAEQMTNAVMQDVFTTSMADTFTLPPQAPRAPHDRRKPTSIYSRRGGGVQPIATLVDVRI
jgi:hypothetical protein